MEPRKRMKRLRQHERVQTMKTGSPHAIQAIWHRPQWMLKSLAIGVLGGLLAIVGWMTTSVRAQTDGGTITLRADIQEANALTGVITARGNVQVEYPARQIYATSAQAQYFSEERRIILSGDVVVLQEGNRLEAETVTYLIEEGRFVALPQPNQQVRTTYILPASEDPPPAAAGENSSSASPAAPDDGLTAPFEPDSTLDISPIDAASSP